MPKLQTLKSTTARARHPPRAEDAGRQLTGAEPRVKVALHTASLEMAPFSDAAIRAAALHFDVFMNKEVVRKQAPDAKRLPRMEAGYRNPILNQRVGAKTPFITRANLLDNGEGPANEFGMKVYGGLHRSSVDDLTALVLACEEANVIPTFWLPEEGLAEKSRAGPCPLRRVGEAGLPADQAGPLHRVRVRC